MVISIVLIPLINKSSWWGNKARREGIEKGIRVGNDKGITRKGRRDLVPRINSDVLYAIRVGYIMALTWATTTALTWVITLTILLHRIIARLVAQLLGRIVALTLHYTTATTTATTTAILLPHTYYIT